MTSEMESYAVVFTYSFDTAAAVYLFDTLLEAREFMFKSYKEELRIDVEENGWNSEGYIQEDGMYAKITNHFQDEGDDVTEFHVANIYC